MLSIRAGEIASHIPKRCLNILNASGLVITPESEKNHYEKVKAFFPLHFFLAFLILVVYSNGWIHRGFRSRVILPPAPACIHGKLVARGRSAFHNH
jgi:hypothetical protein